MNVVMGLAMLVTMLFCIGDLNAAIDSSTPYLILFQNTGLNVWAYALMVILFFLVFLGNITALATTPRELRAFSCDKGFPFSKLISRVCLSPSILIIAN